MNLNQLTTEQTQELLWLREFKNTNTWELSGRFNIPERTVRLIINDHKELLRGTDSRTKVVRERNINKALKYLDRLDPKERERVKRERIFWGVS